MAALDAVTGRDEIDANRVCIVGGSYGGYAALMLGISNPERFRCIGSIAGVTDVNLVVSRSDVREATRNWLIEFIGHPDEDFDELASISPVHLAGDIRIPLFLAHGDQDRTVDIEHAHRLKYGLDRAGIDYVYYEMKGEGHSMDDPEKAAELYTRLSDFLAQSLN